MNSYKWIVEYGQVFELSLYAPDSYWEHSLLKSAFSPSHLLPPGTPIQAPAPAITCLCIV